MGIVLARVDDRLIHGQVTVGWVRSHGIDLILVVDDRLAGDAMQQAILRVAAPPGVEVRACRVGEFLEAFGRGMYEGRRTMLLFTGPSVPLTLLKAGVSFQRLNIGGMRYMPHRRQLTKAVWVSAEEEAELKEIAASGVKVEFRMLPGDAELELHQVLKKEG